MVAPPPVSATDATRCASLPTTHGFRAYGPARTSTLLLAAAGCRGSVLIDEPLFAYRIHGGNIFTAHAQLDRTLNYTIGGHGDSNVKAQLYLIDHLVERAERFTPNLALRLNFIALLWKVDHCDADPALPAWARRSRAAQALVRHYDHARRRRSVPS